MLTQISLIEELFLSFINAEKTLDQQRLNMSYEKFFCLKPIFQRLDSNMKGYISSSDIISFCEDNDVPINANEAFFLLKWLDRNQDGKVTFEE